MVRAIRGVLVAVAVLSGALVTPPLYADMVSRKAPVRTAEELSTAQAESALREAAARGRVTSERMAALRSPDGALHAGQVEILIGVLLFAGLLCILMLAFIPAGSGGGGGGGGGGGDSGSSSGSSGYTYDCRSCGGSGRCANCGGTGTRPSGTCVWCGGKGYCGRCGGDGVDK